MPVALVDKFKAAFDAEPDQTSEREDLAQDPVPGKRRAPGRRRPAGAGTGATRTNLRRQVTEEIEAYLTLLAMPIQLRDDVCGQVIAEQIKPMAESGAALLCRNPERAARFLKTGVLGEWVRVSMAVYPVLKVLWWHHLSGQSQGEGDNSATGGPDLSAFPAYRPAAA